VVKVSKIARAVLYQTIAECGLSEDQTLRFTETDQGPTIDVDKPRKNDRVIKREHRKILLIDKDLDRRLDKATIEIERIADQPRLVMYKNNSGLKDPGNK
jgi:hypothetical protein